MHTGMLWFDNSQSTLPVKIQKAVEYYHKKYGRNPRSLPGSPQHVGKGTNRAGSQQADRSPLPARLTGSHLDWHRGQKLARHRSPCPLQNLPWNWPTGGHFFNR